MKKTLLSSACLLFAALSQAQTPTQPQFPNACSGIGYAVLNSQTNTTTRLYSIAAGGALTQIGTPLAAPSVNALGMDGRLGKRYLWGISSVVSGPAVTATLYRIGSDASEQNMGIINPPTGGLYRAVAGLAGDMDPATGDFYVPAVRVNSIAPANYTLYIGKFNVDAAVGTSITPTYTAINISASCTPAFTTFVNAAVAYAFGLGPEPSGLFQDLALSPDKTKMYGFFGVENILFTIDLATNTATCLPAPASNQTSGYTGCTGANTCEMGGMFFGADGKLYAHQVDRGRFFEVNTTTGALTLLSAALPANMRGDATACSPIDDIPLSVQLVSFAATAQNCDVLVKWTTASEENNSHFEIETSSNGTSYTSAVRVNGNGTTNQTNNYEKSITVNPGANYIRLKQVDIDGKSTYSQAVKVQTKCEQIWSKNLTVFPNRLNGASQVNINVSTAEKANLQIGLYNTAGKNVQAWTKVILPGTNQRIPVQINNLPAGIYLLSITDEKGNKHTERIMVQ